MLPDHIWGTPPTTQVLPLNTSMATPLMMLDEGIYSSDPPARLGSWSRPTWDQPGITRDQHLAH
jgi:hypothetical protein